MTEPPTLAGEIGKVAWFIAKILVVGAAVIGIFGWIFVHNPTAAILIFYGLTFACMIVLFGWQSYKSKKRDWEYQQREQQEREERERERAERLAKLNPPPPA